MTAKRILYIGGIGTISAACVRGSVELGNDVTVRDQGTGRLPLSEGVRLLSADVRDIIGDHAPTWNKIYGWLADAAGIREGEALVPEFRTTITFDEGALPHPRACGRSRRRLTRFCVSTLAARVEGTPIRER